MLTFYSPPILALLGTPPPVALLLTVGFVCFLFRRDFRQRPNVTSALWLPFLWMFLMASKPPLQWLTIAGIPVSGNSWEEGNPIDAFIFLMLTLAGISVLLRRNVNLGEVVRDNTWLSVFFLYCFLAIFWSDFPFVSFKRWIKILGHPVMALIILSEPDPREAFLRLMKRIAYVVLPVSILWIKYYPELGRAASEWGDVMNCGITQGKNALGAVCMILGCVLVWHLLQVWRTQKSKARRNELYLIIGLLLMAAYLLRKAHSATSWVGLFLSLLTMVLLGLRSVNKKVIGAYVVAGIVLFIIAQLTFDIYGHFVDVSGHEETIEGRGRLWQICLHMDTNPIFGTGFESFWLGERLKKIWEEVHWNPGQAHNGYLEMYLNLGVLGLLIFLGVLIATFWKIRLDLLRNFEWGRLRMSLLPTILAHNWTEAAFRGLSLTFFLLFIIAISYRKLSVVGEQSFDTAAGLEEPKLAYS
jgi:exopolysaccharide production protein ExoQ